MPDRHHAPMLFLDFDGTISRADVVDGILERFADRGWLAHEEAWRAGRIGSRQCLALQMTLVAASAVDMEALVSAVEVDEGFPSLLEVAAVHGIDVRIISDGFDYCIERVLAGLPRGRYPRLDMTRVCASHLEPAADGRWATAFPFSSADCDHGCATCKPAVMQALNPAGLPAVFVGDGLSDRYAAAAADVVFAKGSLAAWCGEQGLAHLRYAHLGEVASWLDAAMLDGLLWRAGGTARARA